MDTIQYTNNCYKTKEGTGSFFGKLFPSFSFYSSFLIEIYVSAKAAKKGLYDTEAWRQSSLRVMRALERTGMTITVSGVEHLKSVKGPCVVIGNHMSMMDTVVLPAIIVQEIPLTFIIKQSLMDYPVFKHVMRSRNPIALGRTNAREDLKTVLVEGKKRLEDGISITVFPQTTRGTEFNPKQFNSIGIKLAQKVGVPVLPVAVKTDAWTNGKLIKDLGKIKPQISTHFTFGPPITIEGKGRDEHQQVVDFIGTQIKGWQSE